MALGLWFTWAMVQMTGSGPRPVDSQLIDAAWRNDLPAVKALIGRGADANAVGGWAVYGAADKGYTRMIRCLVAHGADPNVRSGQGDGALDRAAVGRHLDTVRALVQLGAAVNGRDPYH